MKKILPALWMFLLPTVLFAAETNPQLLNALGTDDIKLVIANLIKAMLGLSGALALLMFVWGGFLFLTAGVNAKNVDKAKETIKWATLGLVFIMLSYVLLNALIGALVSGDALQGGGGGGGGETLTCPAGSTLTGTGVFKTCTPNP